MHDLGPGPHLFGLPPGVDFPHEVVAGFAARMAEAAPEDWARATIFVNTHRLGRQIRAAFDEGPARLLPRIRLVTDLAVDPLLADPRPPASPIGRRLELAQLVGRLLESDPLLAPRSALHDLADSLARLIDEMHIEGVPIDRVTGLPIEDQSGHWARTIRFLDLLRDWTDPERAEPSAALRLRRAVEALAAGWEAEPPTDPILVAGSTGSRGATALFMEAVARLPKGAVILPGFDFVAPGQVWSALEDGSAEDHPQYRYARLCGALGVDPVTVAGWTDAPPPAPARNRLISMTLRPAPVTDQWQSEGPLLDDLSGACAKVTLVEAPTPRAEAEAIALRLRVAAGEDRRAILITPDRMLTRQVAAALDRWDLRADDSAGQPLPLSPPGRLLRQVAGLMGRRLTAEALLALLKHPLVATGAGRGEHLLLTQSLELHIRKRGAPFPTRAGLGTWTTPGEEPQPERVAWLDWVFATLSDIADTAARSLGDHLARHRAVAEALAAGPGGTDPRELWAEDAGRKALRLMQDLEAHQDQGGVLSPFDYQTLFQGFLAERDVRNPEAGDPRLLIRGTLEARGETAPLVILAGLNDGIWPPSPGADPWLNRALRSQAGLLLPERQIGLSAHDFMQAVAAEEVWLTRSVRSAEAETVPSRWLNRLANLLGGLRDTGGPEALEGMRARGRDWLSRAAELSEPEGRVPPAPRPSPRIDPELRPRRYSASAIATLIRDPYAIYARHVLRLRAIDPLTQTPDARQRGTVMHDVLRRVIEDGLDPAAPDAAEGFLRIADEVLARDCPWPTTRHLWRARFEAVADWFLAGEVARQARAGRTLTEVKGTRELPSLDVVIEARADRIDLDPEGGAWIYDYKTGTPPTVKAQGAFEKQLLIEAAILAGGGYEKAATTRVAGASYLGLGAGPKEVPAPLDDHPPERVWAELADLMERWMQPDRGFTARIAPQTRDFAGDYDHLARRGEWDDTDMPRPESLT